MLNTTVPGRLTLLACACSIAALSAGCSSINNMLASDKVDYRNSGSKTVSLEVPPDLSQLNGQGRYTHATAGTVSASNFNQQAHAAEPQTAAVAVKSLGGITLEREGQLRWLSVNLPPEQIWTQVREFWIENGFELPVDQAKSGLLETNWSENRAKLGQDGLRQLMGRLIDNLYDTGERDQFRTRIERTARGSEIYISHRGLQEIYVDARKEQTTWKARPADAALEAEMLSRLMVKLGSTKEAAKAAVASTGGADSTGAPRARVMADGLTVALDGDFDQAWRRVGLALDRGGFTVEDRDRSKGVFDVRLAANANQDANKPGLMDKMLGWFSSKPAADTLSRYRLQLSTQGSNSTVIVLGQDGKPAESADGREVAKLLAANLE